MNVFAREEGGESVGSGGELMPRSVACVVSWGVVPVQQQPTLRRS